MRRLVVFAMLLAAATGCRREEKIKLEETDESQPVLNSTANAADPRTAMQFIRGFHGVEQNAWRWTMGNFAVTLLAPPGARERGATVTLKFSIPDSVIERLKKTTLSASIQKTPIGSTTYATAGEQIFRADVPAALLKGEAVNVEFSLNPFLPAGSLDGRELGVIFVSASLEAK